jgi:hypothetical protein
MKYHLPRTCVSSALIVAALAIAPAPSLAADEAPPAHPQGLLHVPDFSGDLWNRNRLTGDWAGTCTDLANKGIQFDVTCRSLSRCGKHSTPP